MALTAFSCDNAKPKDKDYKLSDGKGLYLLVRPNGTKCWRVKYRFVGKEKVLSIGTYDVVPLKDARKRCETARAQIDQGIDPSQAKKNEKRLAGIKIQNSFEAVAREWHSLQKKDWSIKYSTGVLKKFENKVFPSLGKRPISEISPLELLDTVKKVEKDGIYVAHRVLEHCRKVFSYAVITCRADRNPAIDLKDALQSHKSGHYASIDLKDLPEFLVRLEKNEARLFPQTRIGVKLLLLTFVRTGELIKSTWPEFDFENAEWIIPAERMKMRRPHIVPLSKQVIELFKELQQYSNNELTLPGRVDPKRNISENTILFAIGRLGYKGKMTGHGFRSLAMTILKERLGYRHEVVDRQLAHARKNKVDAAYDRAEFLEERKKMMQDYADYLDEVLIKAMTA